MKLNKKQCGNRWGFNEGSYFIDGFIGYFGEEKKERIKGVI